jgi:anti-sigma-K factor RskA
MSKNSTMTGAYVVNALTPEERAAFERELRSSFTLREEVTGLQDTTVLLSELAPEVTPPDYLRTRIMAGIERTPQLSVEATAEPALKPARSLLERLGLPQRWATPRAALGAVGAVGALLVAVAVVPAVINPAPTTGPAAVQAAADEGSKSFHMTDGSSATVIWSHKLGEGYVYTSTASLPSGKVYQLWLTRDDATKSAGLASNGKWTPVSSLQPGDVIRMTVEPQGGSEAPTSKPVMTVST